MNPEMVVMGVFSSWLTLATNSRRCTSTCRQLQEVGVIGCNERGFATHVGSAFDRGLNEVDCISCGQCIVACPTGALYEKDDTAEVWAALRDPSKHVVVGPAPSVRVTLGECFGMPIGSNVEGKMVSALRRLGFDQVFDVDAAADMTILEEGTEFLHRLKDGGAFPMITSCSPGWIRYCEQHAPELIPNLSTCKSPQQMFGSLVKSYYAEKNGIDPKDIYVVSIMPCTAKKYECKREEQRMANGCMPVDAALTTRELAAMITKAGIMFDLLPEGEFDPMLGVSTGASVIFGATGGVMEAALRTVVETVTNGEMAPLEFTEVRGMEGVKEATYELPGKTVRVCAASGLANVKKVIDGVKDGSLNYDFIEFMACPGGCVNGGGQPLHNAETRSFTDIKSLRAGALYKQDADMPMRKSHESPVVKAVYEEYLGEPGSHKAHELLHCEYIAQKRYRVD